jgi:hypothetical protein
VCSHGHVRHKREKGHTVSHGHVLSHGHVRGGEHSSSQGEQMPGMWAIVRSVRMRARCRRAHIIYIGLTTYDSI